MKSIGTMIAIVAGIWSIIGIANVVLIATQTDDSQDIAMAVVLNGIIFVIPGIALGALGLLLTRK